MPDIFFNPYPGAAADIDTGKQILVKTALAVETLRSSIVDAFNPEGDGPISNFTLVRDSSIGCQLNINDLLPSIGGQERTVVSRFYSLFSRGRVLSKEMLDDYDKLTFKVLDTPAPVLEFAIKNDGITASFATEQIWKNDFLEFVEIEHKLPNVWGQEDLTQITAWIEDWYQRNNGYIEELKRKFDADICKGSIKSGDLCKTEWDIIFEKISEARERNYDVDGYMVKDVDITSYGPMKQIKHEGTGLRLYLSISGDRIIVGGLYKKGTGSLKTEKIVQGKAIIKARNKINDYHAEQVRIKKLEEEQKKLAAETSRI